METTKIKKISFEDKNDYSIDANGVLTIRQGVTETWLNMFNDRTDLTEIIIPDSVTKIKLSAFRGCTGLKNITVDKN